MKQFNLLDYYFLASRTDFFSSNMHCFKTIVYETRDGQSLGFERFRLSSDGADL